MIDLLAPQNFNGWKHSQHNCLIVRHMWFSRIFLAFLTYAVESIILFLLLFLLSRPHRFCILWHWIYGLTVNDSHSAIQIKHTKKNITAISITNHIKTDDIGKKAWNDDKCEMNCQNVFCCEQNKKTKTKHNKRVSIVILLSQENLFRCISI